MNNIYLAYPNHILPISNIHEILSYYPTYHLIEESYQIIPNYNHSSAFIFIKENHPIFDVYLLKDKFSYQGNRYKRIFVISVNLLTNNMIYFKTMEAFAQVLSRYGLTIDFNHREEAILYIKKQIETYLTDTLL